MPTEQWRYELLGGMVDDGEDAAITAAREAAKESGWAGRRSPKHPVSFEQLPGQITAPIDGCLQREARHIGLLACNHTA